MSARLIVLDRDGVINRDSPNYITTPEEWEALPGSLEAIAQLCRADYHVVIITNQSGIARGLYSINALNRIHQKMRDELQPVGGEISAIFFCPHAPQDGCACRKPKPGLFLDLAARLKCDLRQVHAVGDSLRDIQAARAAGAKPVLVESGSAVTRAALREASAQAEITDVPTYPDLAAFVDALLAGETAPAGE